MYFADQNQGFYRPGFLTLKTENILANNFCFTSPIVFKFGQQVHIVKLNNTWYFSRNVYFTDQNQGFYRPDFLKLKTENILANSFCFTSPLVFKLRQQVHIVKISNTDIFFWNVYFTDQIQVFCRPGFLTFKIEKSFAHNFCYTSPIVFKFRQ